MFSSTLLSKLSRLALLSVFCAGLFVTSGEVSVHNDGVHIGNGGVYSTMAQQTPQQIEQAAAAGVAAKNKTPEDTTINSIISILNLGIGVLTFLITPLIMLAGWLLSPDWTFGEIFGLRPILHQLWIFISNIVYVIFGFMLVFIAFANIFGGESSKAYEMKTMLPKLVTGMLMVPFTWFIVSAVLSISNVLTASVISLPMDTIIKSGGASTMLDIKIIPKEITFNKDINYGTGENNSETETRNGNFTASKCTEGSTNCLSIKEFLTGGGGGAYNLLSVYAYGIFKIQDYKEITGPQGINKVIDIAMKLGFGTIFFIIFGILVIAIVYALFSRAVMLWLYAMFSPFFALNYVLGDKAKKLEKFTIKEFISLALVPVYVSAALAFGLMFLGLVMGSTDKGTTGTPGTVKGESANISTEGTTTTFQFGDNETGIKFKTTGLLDTETKNSVSSALDTGKGVIGTIIMNVLALAILWMAVMTALGASKITEAAVEPIKGFGDQIGKLAMKAPQYVPIPLPKGADGKDRSISMAGMQSIPSTLSSALSQKATAQGGEIGQSFAKALGVETGELTKALQQATHKLKGDTAISTQKNVWKDVYEKIGDVKTLNSNKAEIIPKFKEMLSATNLKEDHKKKLAAHLEAGNLDEFIKGLEHEFDDETGGKGLYEGVFKNTEEYFRHIKNGAQAQNTIKDITIGTPSATDGKRTIEVILNLNNKDVKIAPIMAKNGDMNREDIASLIKNEYQKLHKKPLDNTEAGKLADEVIKEVKSKPTTP